MAEMGLEQWQLIHPERLEGYQVQSIELPDECALLFVSDEKPEGELAEMFTKVLASMKLELSQARHLYPHQTAQLNAFSLGEGSLTWVWFAGCEEQAIEGINTLSSPPLKQIQGNNQERRALWQQICRYAG
jgi:DNA polymerase-3 subunit psi